MDAPDLRGAFAVTFLAGALALAAVAGLGWLAIWLYHHLQWVSP